jgi:hypothetical protein
MGGRAGYDEQLEVPARVLGDFSHPDRRIVLRHHHRQALERRLAYP